LQQVASTLKEHGATIVAITPQLAEASRSLIEKQRISFDLLSDPGNAYAAKLGLRFTLPDDLKAVYLSFGNDLAVRNGEGSWTLPMPGRFVIDRSGVVRAADVDPDYEHRPEPQKTIDLKVAYRAFVPALLRRRFIWASVQVDSVVGFVRGLGNNPTLSTFALQTRNRFCCGSLLHWWWKHTSGSTCIHKAASVDVTVNKTACSKQPSLSAVWF
jgi:peroxiredoxin